MSTEDLLSILPLMILGGAPVLLLLVIAFFRHHALTAVLTVLSLCTALVSMSYVSHLLPASPSDLLIMDSFGLFYIGLLLLSAIVVTILSFSYLEKLSIKREEYYILLLVGTLGACVLAVSDHMISFFLGFEVLSISLYILIAYLREKPISIEGGIKYLLLAAASSAIMLFGLALVYAETGSMQFSELGAALLTAESTVILMGGIGLALTGFGFKLALAPFHLWAPDVYQGAPAPVTAFIATVSKAGALAVLFRFFESVGGVSNEPLLTVLTVIAIASMLGGNILALLEKNVKRILAYSSIAHLGYILVAFIAGGENGLQAASFYIVAYVVTILAAFGIVSMRSGKESEAEEIEDYSGLFWKQPWMAFVFTTSLLSLAGIPLTAGFMGKYFLLLSGVDANLWLLAMVLVVSSVIGLFYYLRIVVQMLRQDEEAEKTVPVLYSLSGSFILAVVTISMLWFGIYPSGLLEIIGSMIAL